MTKETFELVAEHAGDLIEALDNTAASLETVMVHLGAQMTEADRINRWRLVNEAQALVKKLRGEEELEPVVGYALYDIEHGGSRMLIWTDQYTPEGDPAKTRVVPLIAKS